MIRDLDALGGERIGIIEITLLQQGKFLGIGYVYGKAEEIARIRATTRTFPYLHGDRIDNRMDPMPADLFLERHQLL